jgi:Fe2+ or Zn2+ uptake regulation protein
MSDSTNQSFKDHEPEVIEILRDAGYKYTKPRRQVAQILLERHQHLSAPEVVDAVAERDQSVGRMSVYRTLDLFTRLGLIRPAFQGGPNARYVVMFGEHHHHFVCQGCGNVIHFDECPLDDLKRTLENRFHVEIQGHLLEFFGECEDCHDAAS